MAVVAACAKLQLAETASAHNPMLFLKVDFEGP
jgi:hypothetical protein